MDTIFQLPLFILASIQALLTALHLIPGICLPVSRALRVLRRNTASAAALYTIIGALGLLTATALYEAGKAADKARRGDLRGEMMATIDFLRVQVSAALAASSLLLLLANLALASQRCAHDSLAKNYTAMTRQVQGLQAEYKRVTADLPAAGVKDGGSAATPAAAGGAAAALAAEEAAALRKTVDRLIAEKQELQAAAEAAEKAAKASEAKVTAMVSQIKGFDKEFDRLLDDNKALRARLQQAQAQAAGAGAGAQGGQGPVGALVGDLLGGGVSNKKAD